MKKESSSHEVKPQSFSKVKSFLRSDRICQLFKELMCQLQSKRKQFSKKLQLEPSFSLILPLLPTGEFILKHLNFIKMNCFADGAVSLAVQVMFKQSKANFKKKNYSDSLTRQNAED